jgi:hypothetical protein
MLLLMVVVVVLLLLPLLPLLPLLLLLRRLYRACSSAAMEPSVALLWKPGRGSVIVRETSMSGLQLRSQARAVTELRTCLKHASAKQDMPKASWPALQNARDEQIA